MPVATLPAIRISRSFDATAEEVFAAWTTPALLAEWFGPGTIETEVQELDPVAGGRYRIRMNDSDNGKVHVVHGRFVDLDPPSRLVMTWQWEEEGSYESQVTVTFDQSGPPAAPRTEVVVLHEGLRDQQAVDGHTYGWNACLDKFPCGAAS